MAIFSCGIFVVAECDVVEDDCTCGWLLVWRDMRSLLEKVCDRAIVASTAGIPANRVAGGKRENGKAAPTMLPPGPSVSPILVAYREVIDQYNPIG
jgi:hypothetical protein